MVILFSLAFTICSLVVSTLRTEADLVKGLFAGPWHCSWQQRTLTLHTLHFMDLIMGSPNSLSLSSMPHSVPTPLPWAPQQRMSPSSTLSSTISQQPHPKHACSVSHFCPTCYFLLGYKGCELVGPINKALLTWYLGKEVPSQVASYHKPIRMSRVTKDLEEFWTPGPLLQDHLWLKSHWVATHSTHGYTWPVSNLMKIIKITTSIIFWTPTDSQVLILSKFCKLGLISLTLQRGKETQRGGVTSACYAGESQRQDSGASLHSLGWCYSTT